MVAFTPLNTSPPDFHERAEALADEITELCSYLYAAEYQLLVKIREFDANGYWGGPGLASCAHWLNFKCGMGMNAARERVRVARALAELPKILVRKYRRVQMQREADTANAIYVTREVTYYWDEEGALVFHGRLPAEQGELILRALEMQMEKSFQEPPTEGVSAETPAPTESTVKAEACAETPGEPDTRSPVAARRADALAEIAETYMNSEPVANSTADRYQVVMHVNEDSSYIENGPHVSAETSRRVGCDCSVIRVKEDENGQPLSIGRRSRLIPPAIRRALRMRDDGCRFPGCTRRHLVDAHHIEHWSNGGETNIENLVQLCRQHHRLVHEGGFSCEKTRSGDIVFRDRRKRPLPHWSSLPRRNSQNEAVEFLHEQFDRFGIDSGSCVPDWYAGDTCDWQMAVEGLLHCTAQAPHGASSDRGMREMPRA